MLSGKKVLLCVSGGIAAYKTPDLVRKLRAQGADVKVVATRGALEFVTTAALQAVSGSPVPTDVFDPGFEQEIGHIALARWPDVVLLAPATANTIGRLANGIFDNLLTVVLSACTAPVVVSPAMNTQMLAHPATQSNLARLSAFPGYTVVQPDAGDLACGEVGAGRMPDPPVLIDALLKAISPDDLKGRRVVVTAGPTLEDLDPVRFLSNRSSGKMGFELARAAHSRGAEVELITSVSNRTYPAGVRVTLVRSASDMHSAVLQAREHGVDCVIKAAAVADFVPSAQASQKLKKDDMGQALALTRSADILAELGQLPDDVRPILVGFAAETQEILRHGRAKALRKNVDMLVANSVAAHDSAFGSDHNKVVLIVPGEETIEVGPATKFAVAHAIIDRLPALRRWK